MLLIASQSIFCYFFLALAVIQLTHKLPIGISVDAFEHVQDSPASLTLCACRWAKSLSIHSLQHFWAIFFSISICNKSYKFFYDIHFCDNFGNCTTSQQQIWRRETHKKSMEQTDRFLGQIVFGPVLNEHNEKLKKMTKPFFFKLHSVSLSLLKKKTSMFFLFGIRCDA